jgi:hypothetical protein
LSSRPRRRSPAAVALLPVAVEEDLLEIGGLGDEVDERVPCRLLHHAVHRRVRDREAQAVAVLLLDAYAFEPGERLGRGRCGESDRHVPERGLEERRDLVDVDQPSSISLPARIRPTVCATC